METLRIGSKGPTVKLVQSLLARIGYNPGAVDGIYGSRTASAVAAFQRNNGLVPDGIVGPLTWERFNRILSGYDSYYVQPGDTIYNIALRYYTTINAILTANPGIDPFNLRVGQRITVPYGIDVVFTDIDYTYEILEMNIRALQVRYPFLEVGVAGQSVLGKNLYYIKMGRGDVEVFYNATHHSLEWINTPVLMKFVEDFSKAYANGRNIRGYNIQQLFNYASYYIVPMVNPDGVDLVLKGLSPDNPYYNDLLRWNTTGRPFSEVWNANIRGVDLNRNYPALWEQAKAQEEALGITGPGPTRYGGPEPLSEPETQAMAEFTRAHNFRLVLAYHTQGRVIYWRFSNFNPPRALEIARIFAEASGYTVSDVPYEAAFAGYKDWFIQEYNRPGYTIETGLGVNPLPISQFNTIYENNEEILLLGPIV